MFAVKSEAKDELRRTAHYKAGEVGSIVEPNEADYLRADGIQITKEETHSSVTGHRTIKEYNHERKTGKRDRER